MTFIKAAAFAALAAFSAGSLAAKPTSIVFQANQETTEGTAFASYVVKCSNGKEKEVTAWDGRRKWCVGDVDSSDCSRKQISAAKDACKAS